MRKIMVIGLLFLLKADVYSQQKVIQDFKKLQWLSGNWVRTNNTPGTVGEENWLVVSPSKLSGKGFTLKGTDTVFIEKLTLLIKEKDIFYVVNTKAEQKPVYFKLTEITSDSFVCENPEHDFPTKIVYSIKDGLIKATISGQGKSIDFFFIKKPSQK